MTCLSDGALAFIGILAMVGSVILGCVLSDVTYTAIQRILGNRRSE